MDRIKKPTVKVGFFLKLFVFALLSASTQRIASESNASLAVSFQLLVARFLARGLALFDRFVSRTKVLANSEKVLGLGAQDFFRNSLSV
jgi:hypothetical protein